MFATERNSSICVKSIQRNSSSINPHLPMASGDFSMHFYHDFASSFRRTSPLPCNIAHTHTIFDHGLQMGIAPYFGVLGNVPTLRPHFSHSPPPTLPRRVAPYHRIPSSKHKKSPTNPSRFAGAHVRSMQMVYQCPMQRSRTIYTLS